MATVLDVRQSSVSNPRRTVVRDSLSLGLAVGSYGTAFGAAGAAAGLTPAQCSVLSLVLFSGGSQFAVIGVIGAGGTAAAAIAGAWLLGARNTLYGLRLSGQLGWTGWRRALAAHGMIDETAAMTLPQPDRARSRLAFSTTFASLFALWNVTTVLGAYAAAGLGPAAMAGLDGLVPAAFLALLWPRLTRARAHARPRPRPGAGGPAGEREHDAAIVARRRDRLVAVGGAGIALLLTPFTPPGVPVLAATAAVLLARS